jgi:hypothetical protein
MTEPADLEASQAYTRRDVEAYLNSVAIQQLEIEAALEAARARIDRVAEIENRISSLEQQIGNWIVRAHGIAAQEPQSGRSSGEGVTFSHEPGGIGVESVPSGNSDIPPGSSHPVLHQTQGTCVTDVDGMSLTGSFGSSSPSHTDGRIGLA